MAERPILFSGPLVRAILDGTKTQTRRVAKPEWWRCLDPHDPDDRAQALTMCPHGVPGDRLWVRETWRSAVGASQTAPSRLVEQQWPIWYRADASRRFLGAKIGGPDFMTPEERWRPSIYMPRQASRITLEVTEVRVERVQDISADDAREEGLTRGDVNDHGGPVPAFRHLWDSINEGRGFGWNANPWCWVISFRRAE